ncbi:ABC transporter substrate-binding protein [Erysipelothrix rhusiopathiae]|uniref:ABC transporter substrate-binding protein n=1 Tax=Erysipelothrix rhusiopathiae TaxID=1648 RepID=UPI000F436FE5|nr:ABC transporter substrate-binding protein [Erysipelothrix rhusiopathiae]AYV35006.1 ABC transporter substrate-binding protein [Erysipelothrix rhusiopathiae]
MKKTMIFCMLLLLLVGCNSTKQKDIYTIGVLQFADHPSLDAAYEGMKVKLDKIIGSENYRIIYQNAQGENGNNELMARGFVSQNVDLIYAIGTNSAQSAKNATEGTSIPVVFNAVTDPVSAGLVDSMEQPGQFVTGVSDQSPVEKQLALIKALLPEAKRMGIVYNIGEINSVTQVEVITSFEKDLEVVSIGVTSMQELPIAIQQLAEKVDVIFNITDNMVVASTANIVDIASKYKVPVLASKDGQLDEGILATESLSYFDLGESAGDIICKILVDQVDPNNLSILISDKTKLYINKEVAREFGIEISALLEERNELK